MRLPRPRSSALPVLALCVAACTTDSPEPSATPAFEQTPTPASAKHAHWTYEGATGPEHWADLDPAYALARTGTSQSPIDLVPSAATVTAGPALSVTWHPAPLALENNGHTVQVTPGPGGTLTVGADVYVLKQFHFHAPSEHTAEGKHAPLEVHFVHGDAAGNLAVLGLFVGEGAPNAALGFLTGHAPREKDTKAVPVDVMFDPTSLLPASLATWRYSGSLTTPPCTEGVRWFVLQERTEASGEQLAAWAALLGGNNRPTQPANGRSVESVR